MFEKIDAKNPLYIATYEKYKKIFEEFQNFAEKLTEQAGRATKKSGKANSYARYLIRLAIFVHRQNPNFILQATAEALAEIEKLQDSPNFIKYNKQEKHFPSATIRCFHAFVTEREKMLPPVMPYSNDVEPLFVHENDPTYNAQQTKGNHENMLFEKIDSKHPLYIQTYEQNKAIYDDFEKFADSLTEQAGRATKKSGKASSYARYLMRLTIFSQRQNPNFILAPTFEALKQIEQLRELPQFKDYNKQEKSFPSGAIRCFRAFVTEKAMAVEDLIDTELNVTYLTSKELPNIKEEQLIKAPTKRHEKEPSNYGQAYRRSQNESFAAKERSNYTCEMSDAHFTFLTEHHKKPYVEAHHLIPMAAQDYFEYTIDFAHNIAVLCPTCHRKIHYAQAHEKKDMIQHLFASRKAGYPQYGIEITEELLLSFYKILD
ncbi:HNH endonuclease [Caryophanon latum]|nr:hypothetical protein [Caryophanon latum]